MCTVEEWRLSAASRRQIHGLQPWRAFGWRSAFSAAILRAKRSRASAP